ncbi:MULTISPECIES: helix-turn-helix domain-containing protein [unclassified Sphingobacterium]|uniref:helix-turn-helix domain-containing protein n=1 Tax=unclassified Sphingobacterium TaxID=2609468 RepID=UPI0020C2CAB7|nr:MULTISPECIES: helix-turn-helix domain-containing protein [unclassified Sphingobacterium]MBV2226101.1 AraC family transcriptional regulator [Sphingobacterium mizutaii]
MGKNNLVRELPYSSERELNTLVENRRAYTLNNFELNVYETYQPSHLVPLQFNDMVIINMLKGKKIMHLEDVPAFDYLPGETLVLPADRSMKIDFPDAKIMEPTQCTALLISADKIEETIDYLNNAYPKINNSLSWDFSWNKFHLVNTDELASLTNKLFSNMISNDPFKDVLADLLFKELLIRIIQQQQLGELVEPHSTTNDEMSNLKRYIRENLTERITIEDLSRKANMSKATLFRMFKDEYGITPMELVIRERLRKAKEMLSANMSIKEVCYACGFTDVNYFSRLFKARENMTPGNYQRKIDISVS